MGKKVLIFSLLFCLSLSFSIPDSQAGDLKGLKKRIAVFKFEDKTDHRAHWWSGQSVGDGMADMLITTLVESGKYDVIERTELDNILKEQAMAQSGMVTPESAAQVGKLLGVQLAVVGAVTEFGHEKGGVGGRVKGIGLGVKSMSATVAVDVRFVDTTTGQILDAKNARAEETSRGISVSTPKVDFDNRKDFDESIVGKACRKAIDQIQEMIGKQVNNTLWQAKIVKATGTTIIINAGTLAGVESGMEFVVYTPGEELIDPDTGISLGSEETRKGKIRVTDTNLGNGKAAKCVVVEGTGFDRGDFVREK